MRGYKFFILMAFLFAMLVISWLGADHAEEKQKWHEVAKKDLALVVARTITGPAGPYSNIWRIGDTAYKVSVNYDFDKHDCSQFVLTSGNLYRDGTSKELLDARFRFKLFENLPLDYEENFHDSKVYGVCEKDLMFWKTDGYFLHRETACSNVLGISSDEISDHFYSTSESNAMQDRYQANLHAVAQFIRDSEKPR